MIRESDGLTRGEILERMQLKGDKAGEMSVSNALTALTKGGQVRRDDWPGTRLLSRRRPVDDRRLKADAFEKRPERQDIADDRRSRTR